MDMMIRYSFKKEVLYSISTCPITDTYPGVQRLESGAVAQ